jgi:hypothetical protein
MSETRVALFDANTREIVRRAEARTWVVLLTTFTLIMSGGSAVLHHEWPILDYTLGSCSPDAVLSDCTSRGTTSVLVGIGAAILFALLSVVAHRHRIIRPTIMCEHCGGTGWVMDLEPRNGRCPRCAHDSFTYRAFIVQAHGDRGGVRRLVEHGMHGPELIRRFHETRHSAMTRYY